MFDLLKEIKICVTIFILVQFFVNLKIEQFDVPNIIFIGDLPT
jgi:hypothetical protein